MGIRKQNPAGLPAAGFRFLIFAGLGPAIDIVKRRVVRKSRKGPAKAGGA
jgi:hypothetical protein